MLSPRGSINCTRSDRPPLAALVGKNPGNRMAYEYMIASFLIRREIDSAGTHTAGLRTLNYPKIPRLYEEALLLYGFLTGKDPDLSGYAISDETMSSFKHFCALFYSKHGGRAGDAYRDLIGPFGNSYFFYYLYGFPKARVADENS